MQQNIVFLDTETGGTDVTKHSLLSIAAIVTDANFNEIRRFETFIRHEDYVTCGEAMRKNRIDISKDDTWPDELTVKRRLCEFLGKPVSLVESGTNKHSRWLIYGKNPNFDIRFLTEFLGKRLFDSLFLYYSRDAAEIFFSLVEEDVYPRPTGLTLQDMCQILGIEHDPNALHNAMYDTEMTLKCVRRMHAAQRRVAGLVAGARRVAAASAAAAARSLAP